MAINCLLFLLGIIAVQQFRELPDPPVVVGIATISCGLAYKREWSLCALVFGVFWACVFGLWRMTEQLPSQYHNREVKLQGYIASLPQQQDQRLSFDFVVTQPKGGFPSKLRLNWYHPTISLTAGQAWEFTAKIRKPHGRMNPGGFDIEAWLFANRIGAVGYVREKPAPILINDPFSLSRYLALCRQSVADKLDQALPNSDLVGVVKALTIGSQNGISQEQWQVFRRTGVIHLFVISGSHISLIAGLVYVATRRYWAWTGMLRVSPQQMGSLFAWLAALFYSGLAGYSVPTARAMVMLSVGLAAIAWQRHTTSIHILLLALMAVLLFDPLAVLSVGFWLSFLAVGLLIYVSAGRLGRVSGWREAGSAQWATTIGLSPLLIIFFQQVSLIAPLANWIAVPLIGLIVVPALLVATILLFAWPTVGSLILASIERILQFLWLGLSELAALPLASLSCPTPPWYATALAGVGILVLLAPRGFPKRYLGYILFLPLLFVNGKKTEPGEMRVTLLDVGQGLSTVVETAEHTMVFDTGARYSDYSDMGDSVILPFLHQQGITDLDLLVISHGDNDHSGGAGSLLQELPAKRLLSSVDAWVSRPNGEYCQAGQTWHWDGIDFTVLSPSSSLFPSENDNSCVIKVSNGRLSVLLTGDIERTAELWLVKNYGDQLASDVLIAPHHGSKTSSSLPLLEQTRPRLVLIPSGYLNRFGFPHKQVLERYARLGIDWLNTADHGAITIASDLGGWQQPSGERQRRKRYWMTNDLGWERD